MDLGKKFYEYYNDYVNYCKTLSDEYQRENSLYCLDETIYSMDFYKGAAEILKDEKNIYDIGANTNVQRFFFEQNGSNFIGIDEYSFPGGDYTKGMIIQKYPFEIGNKDACAVSHLCLGFLIPIIDENVEYLRQFKTIIFEYPYITREEIETLKKYFTVSKCLEDVEKGCFILHRK